MTESEIIKLVRQIIRQELAPILMGTIRSNKDSTRSSVSRFSTDSEVPNLRSIQPYGVSSRAPAGTECLIIPVDGNPTHLNMVGQFDKNKPTVNDGESILYGADGQLIYLKSGGVIQQGSKSASEPVVLGNILKACLSKIIEDIKDAPVLARTAGGAPIYIDSQVVASLSASKAQFIDSSSTNIVGQKNFVERGG